MKTLTIPMLAGYFSAIAEGTKTEEFRLVGDYWRARLAKAPFDAIVLTKGYPKGGGVEGETRLTREWRGFTERRLQHPHFGPHVVDVFAIDVSTPLQGAK